MVGSGVLIVLTVTFVVSISVTRAITRTLRSDAPYPTAIMMCVVIVELNAVALRFPSQLKLSSAPKITSCTCCLIHKLVLVVQAAASAAISAEIIFMAWKMAISNAEPDLATTMFAKTAAFKTVVLKFQSLKAAFAAVTIT